MAASYRIEAFDRLKHKRDQFDSSINAVDQYFQKTAGKLFRAGNVSFFVLVEIDAPDIIIGFYTLNAHAVHYSDLPPKYKRSRPGHGHIPAAFLSMMGVDKRHQNTGLGALLLADALRRIARGAQAVATAVVLLDVLTCDDPDMTQKRRAFYLKFGFQPLPSQPSRLFLPISTILTSFAPKT